MAAEVLQPILKAWLSEVLPEESTDGIIAKIPKKGNLNISDNWPGILVYGLPKIISKVMLDWIKYLWVGGSIFHIYLPNTISNENLRKMADMQQIDDDDH